MFSRLFSSVKKIIRYSIENDNKLPAKWLFMTQSASDWELMVHTYKRTYPYLAKCIAFLWLMCLLLLQVPSIPRWIEYIIHNNGVIFENLYSIFISHRLGLKIELLKISDFNVIQSDLPVRMPVPAFHTNSIFQ